jgi:hypothetical protein
MTESPLLLGITARKYVDGEPTETFRTEYELEHTPIDPHNPFFHLHFVPMNGQGHYSLASFHHPSRLHMRGSIVSFDTVNERFSITKWPDGPLRSLKDLWFDWENLFYTAKPFLWDGIVCYHLGGPCARLAHAEDGEARLKRPGPVQYLPFDELWLEENQYSGKIWGDDRFLVIVAQGGYTVFSFDETLDISSKGWKTWENKKEAVLEMQETMEGYFSWLKWEDRERRHRY